MRAVVASALAGLLLFLWSGLSQLFPWGVPTVPTFAATTDDPGAFQAPHLVRVPAGTFTTPAFDERLGDGIATLTTDRSFAWVVSIPRERYDPGRYFGLELLSQLVVAALLVAFLRLTGELPRRRRVQALALLAAAGLVATYGVMANWWGLPARYALGLSVNVVVGWCLAAVVALRVLAPSRAGVTA